MEQVSEGQHKTFGRYIVDRKIGSGGMADAFRCLLEGPSGFQKFVLLKALRVEHKDSSHYYGMFLDEARLCAQLQHPNIPVVFELDEQDGLPFFVMEYVAGPNLVMLHRKLREGKERHYGHIALIFERVARALHHAHTLKDFDGRPMNLIHRDVSLANILVGKDGHPKLIDFGIAKWDNSEAQTELDVLKGKLRYMAPEQLLGKKPTPRVDVYQVGVALFWLSTGRAPYDSPSSLHGHAAKSPPPAPTSLQYGYPEELERIVLRCLERDPDDRYQTTSALAEDLKAFMASAPDYDSSEQAVSSWISQLFPQELEVYTSRSKTGSRELSHTRPLPGHGTEDLSMGTIAMTQPQPDEPKNDRISLVGWAGLVVVAVVSAVMTLSVLDRGKGSDFSSLVASDPDAAAQMLLDKAQGLVEEREVAAARAMLLRAGRIDGTSPDVDMRSSRLDVAIQRISLMSSVERSMMLDDYDKAFDKANEILDLLPNDDEALKVVKKIRDMRKEEEAKAAAVVAAAAETARLAAEAAAAAAAADKK